MIDFKPQNYSADQPIESRSQDLLGRSEFSDSIASAIKNWKGKNSLVLATYGGWGMGKSSIKSLILENLKSDNENCPYIVEFNPWLWSNHEKLTESFFKEVGFSINESLKDSSDEKVTKSWNYYAAHFSLISASFGFVSNMIICFSFVCILFVNEPSFHFEFLNKYLNFLPYLSLLLGIVMKVSKSSETMAMSVANLFSAKTDLNKKSLEVIKKDLTENLLNVKKPILVVIDDVDRLPADEIKVLFQLIKANANFPNLIFLLFFQRDVVERSLTGSLGVSGREYLEKIIQLGFNVPEASKQKIESVLFSKLEELLSDEVNTPTFDTHRWGNVYQAGFKNYFKNLRDVYRYVSTLQFHIGLFRNQKFLEVNIIDLIVLEGIRVFEPLVYERLKVSKAFLTDYSREHKSVNPATSFILGVNPVGDDQKSELRRLLAYVFPNMNNIPPNGIPSYENKTWVKEMRACHVGFFDRYFQLSIPSDDVSSNLITRIVNGSDFKSNLVSEFQHCISGGNLKIVLDRLESYHSEIPSNNLENLIGALFDIGDQIKREPQDRFNWNTSVHAYRLIHWSVERLPDRPAKFIKILKETRGIYLPLYFVSRAKASFRDNVDKNFILFEQTITDQMVNICLSKIEEAVKDGRLGEIHWLDNVLGFWSIYGDAIKCREWSLKYLSTNKENLFNFIEQFIRIHRSYGLTRDLVAREEEVLNAEEMSIIVPINYVEDQLSLYKYKDDDLNKRQLEVKKIFQKARNK